MTQISVVRVLVCIPDDMLTRLPDFCNSKMIEEFDKVPLNTIKADELLSKYIDVYNKIIEKAPKGLASHSSGNAVTWHDMVAKLKLVGQVADKVWPGEY